jgi:hypothetical protein
MRKLIFALIFFVVASIASAQKISFDPENGAIGAGAMLTGDEGTTFTWDSAFAAVKWHSITFAGDAASTGVGLEIHPGAMLSFTEGNVIVNQIDSVDARIWSLNRVKASVLQVPGEIWESMYLGSDLLVYEFGSKDWTGDFTARFVYGVEEEVGSGKIQFEFYMFEKYRPISFCIFYHF